MSIRLGFVRIMRFYIINHSRWWVIPMHRGTRRIPGWDIGRGGWHVQIAWCWWGFGIDGGKR